MHRLSHLAVSWAKAAAAALPAVIPGATLASSSRTIASMVGQAALGPNDVVIVSAVRLPMGAFQGSLSCFSATQLGGFAIKAALERAGIPPDAVGEVFMGNVCSANLGQAPATQAALAAGLPSSVPCTTINKVCSSSMKALVLGAQTILTGDNSVVVVGGMESMSNIPHYLPRMRSGIRLGHAEVVDGMVKDGLWDPYNDWHMGSCAELCAEQYGITRQQMDDHAVAAFKRAQAAAAGSHRDSEVVGVEIPPPRPGQAARWLSEDESLAKLNPDKLRKLQPHFKQDGGSVTAGNSSPITDGASAMVLMNARKAQQLGAPMLAVLRGYGDANQDPQWFTTAPAAAAPKAIARAGLQQEDIDYWEINQAFSVVDLVNQQLLGLSPDRVNVHGGAVALGHPLGASGAIIVTRLIHVLRSRGGRYGCAAICNGGGGASAVVIEAISQDAHM